MNEIMVQTRFCTTYQYENESNTETKTVLHYIVCDLSIHSYFIVILNYFYTKSLQHKKKKSLKLKLQSIDIYCISLRTVRAYLLLFQGVVFHVYSALQMSF